MTERKLDSTTPGGIVVRPGSDADVAAINEIYNHYVVSTPVTFDIEPWSMSQRREWMRRYGPGGRYRIFVAEAGGAVIGYADSHQFRQKAAYDTTVEPTVYSAPDGGGGGTGTALYSALFESLRSEDVRLALALITLPNDASVALHQKFGFTLAGVMHDAGRKFDKYWNVAWYEKPLS